MAGEQEQIGFDVINYARMRDGGGLKMQRLMEEAYQIVIPQYDPTTREPRMPMLVQVNRKGMNGMIADLQSGIDSAKARIAACETLKADMDALDKAEPA